MAIHLTPPEPVEEVLSPALVYAHHPEYSVAMKSEFDVAKKTAKEMKKNPTMILTHRERYDDYKTILESLPTIGRMQ